MAQSLTASDVLQSSAVGVWVDLEAAGVALRLSADGALLIGPAGRVTPEQVATVRAHKDALRLLVSQCDAGVQVRRDVFACQLAQTPAPSIPGFVLKPDTPYTPGRCFSCADPLPEPRFGRCWRCSVAWRLAAGVPIDATLADVLDTAKVVA